MIAQPTLLTDRKEEILQVAQKLFSEKGYSDASMRDLADALGIKPASLYSNFKSKEIMLWEIAIRCAKEFHDKISPIYESDFSPKEKLSLMLAAHIEVIIKNIDASAIFFREWRYLGEEKKSVYAASQETYQSRFTDVVDLGIKEGAFRKMRPGFATLTLLATVNWIHKWYKPSGNMKTKEIKEELLKQALFGIKKNTDTTD